MKRYFTFLPLFALLILSSCIKEPIYYPDPYPPTYPGTEEFVFIEDFNNDRNGWSFSDPMNYAWGEVSHGTFKLTYLDDWFDAYYSRVDVGLNINDDFIVEAKIGSDNTMGILFGQNYHQSIYGYTFLISEDGYFSLYDEGGNGYGPEIQELIAPTFSSAINRHGHWNIVTFQQVGNHWIGYINDIEVFRIQRQGLRGREIGFSVLPFTEGEADYLDALWYR